MLQRAIWVGLPALRIVSHGKIPIKTIPQNLLAAKFVVSRHCEAAFFVQVQEKCSDLDLTLLYILMSTCRTRFQILKTTLFTPSVGSRALTRTVPPQQKSHGALQRIWKTIRVLAVQSYQKWPSSSERGKFQWICTGLVAPRVQRLGEQTNKQTSTKGLPHDAQDTVKTLRTIIWYKRACIGTQSDIFLSPSNFLKRTTNCFFEGV